MESMINNRGLYLSEMKLSEMDLFWNKAKLEDLSEVMAEASICGLGQAATNPLRSIMKYFEEEITYE